VRRIARVSARLETGIVGINEGALASEAAPFGGVKESGYGREGSRTASTTTCRSSICARAGSTDRLGGADSPSATSDDCRDCHDRIA
jgi:hypothetical protein